MSRRTERIASLIRMILADAIQSRLSDPRIERLTSITRVEVSADLAVARVYVSVMANEARQKLSVEALQHAAGRLRSLVAREVSLRQAPQLAFRLDDSIQRSFQTVQQLDRIMAELGDRPSPGSGNDSTGLEPRDEDPGRAHAEQLRGEPARATDKPHPDDTGGHVLDEQEDR